MNNKITQSLIAWQWVVVSCLSASLLPKSETATHSARDQGRSILVIPASMKSTPASEISKTASRTASERSSDQGQTKQLNREQNRTSKQIYKDTHDGK